MSDSKENFEKLVRPQWGWRTYLGCLSLVAVLVVTAVHIELDFISVITNSGKYIVDLGRRMFPPDVSNLVNLLISMLETIEIALWGTFIAIVLSIPFGITSARNIVSHRLIYLFSKVVTVFFRAIPEFILAMFLVIAVGFGAISGVFALGLHTMGFLSKFYAEEIEHIASEPVNALRATGAGRTQTFMFAIVPQVLPSFVGYNLYIFDRNIRMATMLGIVGAGGIGYELVSSFRMFQYQRVTTIIVIIFIAILLIDIFSGWVRKKLL
jgi:phosphonate transport system permease protein